MKFILGTKQNMTQVFNQEGKVFPVTVLNSGDMTVLQVKTKGTDGYSAIKIGFGDKKTKSISKPVKGQMKDLGSFRTLKEFRLNTEDSLPEVGHKITLEAFNPGDIVEVSSISKGKGFQGVVKRHGFKGGPRSHGQKHSEREPGSIGGGGRDGGRVAKGMRMAGRTGGDRITVKNLKIVDIDRDNKQIYILGAVPGRRGTLVEIKG